MSVILVALLVLLAPLSTTAEPLSIERIHGDPALAGKSPNSLQFSPDGQRVTFLRGKDSDFETLDLWEFHIPSGKTRLLVDSDNFAAAGAELSDEEKARRERQRISSKGIISYQWSEDGKALLFPLGGDVFYYEIASGGVRQLTATPEFETDPKISPLGNYVSYIRAHNLFVRHIESDREIQLTRDGDGIISNGSAEFVADEEMGRHTGYWWAPDESQIAYMRVDNSPVEIITRSEIYADGIKMVEQRYPKAGAANAEVKLGLVPATGGQTRWIALAGPDDGYLPRVRWLPDSKTLSHQWQSRNQQELDLYFTDTGSGRQRRVLSETANTWINLTEGKHQGLYFLEDGKHFLWTSERSGFRHLYLFDLEGKLVRTLTQGNWVVNELLAVDEANAVVYFTANRKTPIEQHLYRVPLESAGQIEQITRRTGFHSIQFADDGAAFVDSYSNASTPPQVSLHRAGGEQITWLEENRVTPDHPFYPYQRDWIQPEFGSLKTADGAELFYRLFKPRGSDKGGSNKGEGGKQFPAIVYLYGGPGAQMVTDAWPSRAQAYLFLQYLAQQGYVVFTLDNRGSASRGTAFENPIYRRMGGIELEDQLAGVRFLRGLPFVDGKRVGIHGHSYGGYMTLMAMFRAGDYFAAGVAGSPVSQWESYDTHYTERYMSTPQDNADGYKKSSVLSYAEQLEGDLLVYHGMADDNVLFTHSTRLYKALQDAAIPFEIMDYPGKKHSIRGKNTGIHLHKTIANFFDRYLK